MTAAGPGEPGTHGPADLLRRAAAERFTGRLDFRGADGDVASVWLADGRMTAAAVPGPRPRIGVRLMSAGLVSPEALDDALRRQGGADAGQRPLGAMLVDAGAVTSQEVEAVAHAQAVDMVSDLLGWDVAAGERVAGEAAAAQLAEAPSVEQVLAETKARQDIWQAMVARLGGPEGLPSPSMVAAPRANLVLGPYDWAVLTKVDGVRTLEALAELSGLSLTETAQILSGLADMGLIVLPHDAPHARPEKPVSDGSRRRAPLDTASLLRELSALNRDGKND